MDIDLYLDLDDSQDIVEVFNPTNKDFVYSIQGNRYFVPKRGRIELVKHHADILSKHLSKKMTQNLPVITQKSKQEALKKIRLYEQD